MNNTGETSVYNTKIYLIILFFQIIKNYQCFVLLYKVKVNPVNVKSSYEYVAFCLDFCDVRNTVCTTPYLSLLT
jgi:hypothetical protein